MAFKRISDLAAATGTLDGTELLEIETAAGSSKKCTTQDIADLGGSGGGGGMLAGINDQTGTSYTLVLGDAGKDVRCTNAAAVALTIPPNSDVAFPVGTWLLFSQGGAGAVTAMAGTGVALNAASGLATASLYDVRGLEKVGTDTWRVL